MIARNCSQHDLESALETVNRFYSNNIRFRRLEPRGKHFLFTLTVDHSTERVRVSASDSPTGRAHWERRTAPGARLSIPVPWRSSQKTLPAACWHVHGHFFEALLALAPDAVVTSSWIGGRQRVTREGGNWNDPDVGPQIAPVPFSSCCACDPEADMKISAALDPEVRKVLA